MSIRWERDGDYLVYTNNKTWEAVRIWAGNVVEAAFVAREWHTGQNSALYKLGSGHFSLDVLRESRNDLGMAIKKYRGDDEEDVVQAQAALYELESAVRKIEAIESDK